MLRGARNRVNVFTNSPDFRDFKTNEKRKNSQKFVIIEMLNDKRNGFSLQSAFTKDLFIPLELYHSSVKGNFDPPCTFMQLIRSFQDPCSPLFGAILKPDEFSNFVNF